MQCWIDTSSAIGTTEVTGRFIKTDWTIPTGMTYKNYANGPTGGLSFTKTGRKKRHAEATIEIELNTDSIGTLKEYQTLEVPYVVKMRIRLNGSLIESVTPDYYSYVQLTSMARWTRWNGDRSRIHNRTMIFNVQSEYNSTLGASWALYSQNTRTTL